MWEFNISLRSFQQVQDFVALASAQSFDVSVGNERQEINGKDLMGMFSLDYTNPLQVKIHCSEEAFLRFRQDAAPFLA
jgi:phosphotransferase system HPr-like phosphotransfer protein